MTHLEQQIKRTSDPLKKQFIKLEIEREKRKAGIGSDEKVLKEANKYAAMANERGTGYSGIKDVKFKGVNPFLLAR